MAQQCSAIVYGPRVHSWQCCRAGVVTRDGKLYCKQHDPERVEAARLARSQRWREKQTADEARLASAEALCRQLGCGSPAWNSFTREYTGGVTLTHDEATTLTRLVAETGALMDESEASKGDGALPRS